MLAEASRCWFIYIQHCMGARGEEYGKPTEAVNSTSENPRQVIFKQRQKWLTKIRIDVSARLSVRRLNGASEESQLKLPFQSTPLMLQGFAGLLSEWRPHCSLWIHYNVHCGSQSVAIISKQRQHSCRKSNKLYAERSNNIGRSNLPLEQL